MNELRYEPHITSDPKLPFIIHREMTIKPTSNPIPNWHDDIEIINCKSGSGYVLKDGKRIELSAGDTVIIEPLAIHNVLSDGSVSFFLLTPSRDFCISNGLCTDGAFFPNSLRSAELDGLFSQLESNCGKGGVCQTARIRRSVLNILISLIENHAHAPDVTERTAGQSFVRVRNTIKYIRGNYASDINLDAVARTVGINKYSLSREFKKYTGISIIEYLNSYRCRIACEYLNGGMNVSEAAFLCGFSNISYFSKTFRSFTGILPSEAKKEKN